MRRPLILPTLCLAVAAVLASAHGAAPRISFAQSAATPPAPQQSPPAAPAQSPTPTPAHSGPVIVIDPAHGGTDTGARGANGIAEKDITLVLARFVRMELERQGFRVVMTRNDDSNPSYDDRAAMANLYRDAIFVSIHISSTGSIGTARSYSYQFPNFLSASAGARAGGTNLVSWEEAQRPYVDASRRLADVIQGELAARFSGSPAASVSAAVRGLRSVSAPAVAIELASVSVSDASTLSASSGPLAASIVRSLQAFRPTSPAGGK